MCMLSQLVCVEYHSNSIAVCSNDGNSRYSHPSTCHLLVEALAVTSSRPILGGNCRSSSLTYVSAILLLNADHMMSGQLDHVH